jgi:hypothetical protein
VPAHVDYEGIAWEFLPLPADPEGTTNRAVFFVERGTHKGTDRWGQEYVEPLLMLTGREYETISFAQLFQRLEDALDGKYGARPVAVIYGPDGKRTQ